MVKVKYGDGEVQKRLRILTNAGARQTLTGGGIGWLLPGLLARLPACLLADSATLSFFSSFFFFLCLGGLLISGSVPGKRAEGTENDFCLLPLESLVTSSSVAVVVLEGSGGCWGRGEKR